MFKESVSLHSELPCHLGGEFKADFLYSSDILSFRRLPWHNSIILAPGQKCILGLNKKFAEQMFYPTGFDWVRG